MPRAKGGYKSRHRRNRIRKHAKGFRGGRSKLWKAAVEAVHRKWRYALFHRRKRKPDFRGLWIVRINAAARELGVSYSQADRRARQGEHRPRPQDPLRSRHQRSGRLQEGRRDGAGRGLAARPTTRTAEASTDVTARRVQRRQPSQLDRRARSAGRRVRGRDRRARDRAGDPARAGALPRQEGEGLRADEGARASCRPRSGRRSARRPTAPSRGSRARSPRGWRRSTRPSWRPIWSASST